MAVNILSQFVEHIALDNYLELDFEVVPRPMKGTFMEEPKLKKLLRKQVKNKAGMQRKAEKGCGCGDKEAKWLPDDF